MPPEAQAFSVMIAVLFKVFLVRFHAPFGVDVSRYVVEVYHYEKSPNAVKGARMSKSAKVLLKSLYTTLLESLSVLIAALDEPAEDQKVKAVY